MKQKDYSQLINKTFKQPYTGKHFRIKNITADGKAELPSVVDKTNIETILNTWEAVNESATNESLICG